MALFDEAYLHIHWIEHGNIIWAEWKNTASGEQIRHGLDAGLKILKDKASSRWIADIRQLGAVDPNDSKWINDEWVPLAVAAGVRQMAFVMPETVLMQVQLKSFMARIDGQELANKYFASAEEAADWLRT